MKTFKDAKHSIDHTKGPRVVEDGIKVGSKLIQFNDDGKIIIDGVDFKGTLGLYKLLFKRILKDVTYTEADMRAYKYICIKTNAHKLLYNPNGQVNRNPISEKYKCI